MGIITVHAMACSFTHLARPMTCRHSCSWIMGQLSKVCEGGAPVYKILADGRAPKLRQQGMMVVSLESCRVLLNAQLGYGNSPAC